MVGDLLRIGKAFGKLKTCRASGWHSHGGVSSRLDHIFLQFDVFAANGADRQAEACRTLTQWLLQSREGGKYFGAVTAGIDLHEDFRDFSFRVNDEGVACRKLHAVVVHQRAVCV